MKREPLEIPKLDLLPKPPPAVEDAIWHWKQYLRFQPAVGPRRQTMCGGIEKEYRHTTRKLQAQWHPQDPDEKAMYDYWLGYDVEWHMMPRLLPLRRALIKHVQVENWLIQWILDKHKINEPTFIKQLLAGYNNLAGQIATRNLRK